MILHILTALGLLESYMTGGILYRGPFELLQQIQLWLLMIFIVTNIYLFIYCHSYSDYLMDFSGVGWLFSKGEAKVQKVKENVYIIQ